ncbi:P-loop containing nucleoside triphosphate hydrolase protein [Xylaria grammica]|nr:P-loop containing nucleoside triphosphate hydrolase protein [Xylaria grammica]
MTLRKIMVFRPTSLHLPSLAMHNHDQSDNSSFIFDDSSCDNSSTDSSLSSTSNGLEEVKRQFLNIKSMVAVSKLLGCCNPGTGKTTIARLYGKFLKSLDVLPVSYWTQEELSGMQIINKGLQEVEQKLTEMVKPTRYEVGKLAIVFIGYKDEMDAFFQHNPGLSSRIPYTLDFKDFTNHELWMILCKHMGLQWKDGIEVEGGIGGLYMRCIICCLGACRGSRGFGNARAACWLVEEVQRGKTSDYRLLTKEDLLGPDPLTVLDTSEAFFELQKLVGLEKVKDNVTTMINLIRVNYRRELHEVFVGKLGTGKTTVARLYGRILADLGFLSRDEVIFKTPADFIGDCLGKSELLTKNILEALIGKVLVIDEATMFHNANPGLSQLILHSKMRDRDLSCTHKALTAACEIFNNALATGNSTNVGIVDRALDTAIMSYMKRVSKIYDRYPNPKIRAVDFNLNIYKVLKVDYRTHMEGRIHYSLIDQLMLQLIPTRFLFSGSPGTGKTTMATFMSKLFFDMGYISTPDIIEIREKLTDAFSWFFVINDVHYLLDGLYETQALDELAQFLSQPVNRRSIIVVLSGDEKSMNELMKRPNMSTIFCETIVFGNFLFDDCITLLDEARFARNSDLSEYGKIRTWNNAYDVKHLASQAMNKDLPTSIIIDCMEEFITQRGELKTRLGSQESSKEKNNREERYRGSDLYTGPWRRESRSPSPPRATASTRYQPMAEPLINKGKQPVIKTSTSENWEPAASFAPQNPRIRLEAKRSCYTYCDEREKGMEKETRVKREQGKLIEDEKTEQDTLKELDEKLQEAGEALVRGTGDERKTLQKSYDQAYALYTDYNLRLQHRQKIKRALKKMGTCEVGFAWRRDGESGGYRCEGGSHFVTDEEINNMSEYED